MIKFQSVFGYKTRTSAATYQGRLDSVLVPVTVPVPVPVVVPIPLRVIVAPSYSSCYYSYCLSYSCRSSFSFSYSNSSYDSHSNSFLLLVSSLIRILNHILAYHVISNHITSYYDDLANYLVFLHLFISQGGPNKPSPPKGRGGA